MLRSVIEINPDAERIAAALDAERTAGRVRGPLHGLPILVKDNIDTADSMLTTAGSLALVDTRPARDAFTVACLRRAGAVLLGKANLSEWANFRSTHSSSGWSARGGQCLNPWALDRTPSGSSSGSAAAVAAGIVVTSLGTETDGSILSPASACGVVGIKPTVGLTSRAGVIPVAHSQDTVGVFGRSVADAAAVLGALTGMDAGDPATQTDGRRAHDDYTQFLKTDGLRGARIGVARDVYFAYCPKAARIADEAIDAMRVSGASIIDPADITTARSMDNGDAELEVLLHEFKAELNAYLAGRSPNALVRSLDDLIRFNQEHADTEMQYFDQELLEMAVQRGPTTETVYLEALRTNHELSRERGIDAVMESCRLDALVMPTGSPAIKIDLINGGQAYGGSSRPAALAGYPAVTVPAGYASGLPVGLTFVGRAWSEPILLRLAYAFERATQVWRAPGYILST
ncbi:MAG: amidase [Chloroflexota bacterium]